MVESNERMLDYMKGGHDVKQPYQPERQKMSGFAGGTTGSSFVPAYKKGMFAPKFREPNKYK